MTDEPIFTIHASDPGASDLVRQWARQFYRAKVDGLRGHLGKRDANAVRMGLISIRRRCDDAESKAAEMDIWLRENTT